MSTDESVSSSLSAGYLELECVVIWLDIVYLYKERMQNWQVCLPFGIFKK